jgi:exopolyphosphatase/guanosine-5'-triphosphate,3'-diphosphate pyrophosphatase
VRAAIDIGSNSILLVVSEWTGESWRPVHEGSWVTGLGRGRAEDGSLAEPAMTDSLMALREAGEAAARHGALLRAWGTAALRQAPNAEEFIRRAEEDSGVKVSLLSGDDEARLGLECVLNDPLFSHEDRLTIIDPGGRSTELATAMREGGGWRTLFRVSVPVGAQTLLDGPYQAERPTPADHLAAVCLVDDLIGQQYLPGACGRVAALGAAGSNLVSIREKLARWSPAQVHGQDLDYEEVAKAVSWLSGLTLEERSALVGIEKGREATLPAGALILERFMNAVHCLGCRVSVRGWRHAALEMDEVFFGA